MMAVESIGIVVVVALCMLAALRDVMEDRSRRRDMHRRWARDWFGE